MPDRLRLFISSPGDVGKERLRVELIVDRITPDYLRHFRLETYRWEYEPMLASGHFQDSIEPPSAFDIVVLIVWSRLGTPLPARTAQREYRGMDGRAPVTGTEWEFEDALSGWMKNGRPDVLAFRNVSNAPTATADPAARKAANAQLDALDAFWRLRFADKGVFIAGHETYRELDEFEAKFEPKLRRLIERRIAALDAVAVAARPAAGSPFRGLEAYDFNDAEIFRGRDGLVARAIERLAARAKNGPNFLLVSGPSGSGKSSLVKAGLVPRLMKRGRIEGAALTRRAILRPSAAGADPFLALAAALVERHDALPELLAPGLTAQDLATPWRESASAARLSLTSALARLTGQGRDSGRLLSFESAHLILIVDQLEELVTNSKLSDAERRSFARVLAALARSGQVWIVATLRDDFWPSIAKIPELAELAEGEGRFDVGAPSRAEVLEILRGSAQAAALRFETHPTTGLTLDAVLAEAAADEPGALPLLSFTLEALYQADIVEAQGAALTFASYDALGGLKGAIANHAETISAALPEAARAALPRVLRAMTTAIEGSAATVARPAPLSAFPPGTPRRQAVDALLAGRLLVGDDERGEPVARLAHEALLTHWERARQQILVDRRDIETRRRIETQMSRWRGAEARQRAALLLRDPDLASARDLRRRWGDELDGDLADFIYRSERAARRASVWRWTIASATMVVLLVLAAASMAALIIAQDQRDAALIALSRGLIRDSRAAVLGGDASRGMRLALEALPPDLARPNRPFLREGAEALANAYVNRREMARWDGGDGALHALAFSADGQRILVASESGMARLWRPDGSSLEIKACDRRLYSAVFSPDGARVLTACADGRAQLWNALTAERSGEPMNHDSDVVSAAFSPDGALVLTGSLDGLARLWDARTGKALGDPLRAGDDSAPLVAFSPRDDWALTVSETGGARLWNARTGALVHKLAESGEAALSAAFSPDGALVLVGADDGVARLWDARRGALVRAWPGHGGGVGAVAFSPDGARAATGSGDRSTRIWSIETGKSEHVLYGHSGPIDALAFSPDGRRLATASEDHTARLWDVATGVPVATLGADAGAIEALAFSPDGARIATASRDGAARLWSVEPLALAAVLPNEGGGPLAARISADGSKALLVGADRVARLWDIAKDAKPLGPALPSVATAEFSPDGRRIVTTSLDTATRITPVGASAAAVTLNGLRDRAASFSADGTTVLVLPADGAPHLFDAETGADKGALEDVPGPPDFVVISGDGKTIFVAVKNIAAGFWDAKTRQSRARLEGYAAALKSAAFSPNGERLVTASFDNSARIWNVATGKMAAPPLAHANGVTSAVFSSDGGRVLTTSLDHSAVVWDAATGARMANIKPPLNSNLAAAAFSPDGTRVAIASDDGTASLWDALTGEWISTFTGQSGAVTSAIFTPDGARLLTASADGAARLWFVPPSCQALIGAAQAAAADTPLPSPKSAHLLSFYERAEPLIAWLAPQAGETCH